MKGGGGAREGGLGGEEERECLKEIDTQIDKGWGGGSNRK